MYTGWCKVGTIIVLGILNVNTVSLGVEKLNYNCRRIHLQKSNKWDAAKDVLLAEERLGELNTLQRTPRNYKKKLEEYWSGEISANRSGPICVILKQCQMKQKSQKTPLH